jgi:hypothetical protein
MARLDGGDWMLTGMVISAVSIANLAEVEHHIIAHIADSTAHHVRFHGGGELHYVFNTRGEIVDLWARKVQITLTLQRQLIVKALHTAAA